MSQLHCSRREPILTAGAPQHLHLSLARAVELRHFRTRDWIRRVEFEVGGELRMPDKQDRSIGELFSELASDTGTLIRKEIELAKVELTQTANRVGQNVGYLVLGER